MEITFDVHTPDEMAHLACKTGRCLRTGDVVLLSGPVGAGKSHFARALIADRLASLGRGEDIPSPSFTLVQTYDLGRDILWHVDLFRLQSADEAMELGLEEAFEASICLIEWPDRLGAALPTRYISVTLELPDAQSETRAMKIGFRGDNWTSVLDAIRSALPGASAA